MNGIGFFIVGIIRIVTFVIVLVIKIMKAEDQNAEKKATLKIVGGMTLVSLITHNLVFFWIELNEVLRLQITWLLTMSIFGIGIPCIIIKRSENMTQYLMEYSKRKIQEIFPCVEFDENSHSELGNGDVFVHDTVYPDDICIHGASYPNETELELVHKITQGLSCDNHVTLSKPSDVTSKIIQVQTI